MSEMDLEELIATRILNGLDDGMYEDEKLKEYIKIYEDLKRNRDTIKKIEPDFFFEVVGGILKDYERCLERESKNKFYLSSQEKEDLIDFAELLRPEQTYYKRLIKKMVNEYSGYKTDKEGDRI